MTGSRPGRRVFGIVLAAGLGSRMGGPKTRLMLDDRSFLWHHAERLAEVGCAEVVLVVRPDDPAGGLGAQPRARSTMPLTARPALVVPARPCSQAESFARGLDALARVQGDVSANDVVIVMPVDMLPPRRSTMATLVAAALAEDVDAVTPRLRRGDGVRERSGHPIVVRFGLVSGYLGPRGSTKPLRDVVRASRRVRLDVDDDAIVSDLDTPRDLAIARQRAPALRFL